MSESTPRSMTWTGTVVAQSSIAHAGETRGTMTLLRRELVLSDDGRLLQVPVISGNAFRGVLRRTAEELLREVLAYEGEISLPVVHALRSGGALVKTSKEALSGSRLARLRELVPLIGVFGAAGGGRIIDGSLQVGKLVPHFAETRHMLDPAARAAVDASGGGWPAFTSTQLESYTRLDESTTHAGTALMEVHATSIDATDGTVTEPEIAAQASGTLTGSDSQQMLFRVETYPAGTRFAAWLHLDHASSLEQAFFVDVLQRWRARPRIGGRTAIGHGQLDVDLTLTGGDDKALTDWRCHLLEHRDEALEMMELLA